ncbi:MAG: hypothetical protein IID41_07870, partial [Planctomycetes bacterium]|nr:hypothetical protein [Planctomycetota bacterium]
AARELAAAEGLDPDAFSPATLIAQARRLQEELAALEKQQDFTSRFDELFGGATDFVEDLQLQVMQFDMSPFEREIDNIVRAARELATAQGLDPDAFFPEFLFAQAGRFQKELDGLRLDETAQGLVDSLSQQNADFCLSPLQKQLQQIEEFAAQGADPAIIAQAQKLLGSLAGKQQNELLERKEGGSQRGTFLQAKQGQLARVSLPSLDNDVQQVKDPQLVGVLAQLAQINKNTLNRAGVLRP